MAEDFSWPSVLGWWRRSTESWLRKSENSSPPSKPIEVDFTEDEITDLRTSVQSEFSAHLGYPVELEDVPGTEVVFRILGAVYLADSDEQAYREIFWRHQRRIVEAQMERRARAGLVGFPLSFEEF